MKILTLSAAMVFAVVTNSAFSQAPGAAPAGTTGVCKDGTFSTAASKAGACSGHKGVKTWMEPATVPPAPGPALKMAPAAPIIKGGAVTSATPVTPVTPALSTAATKPRPSMAAGAGADKVWVNPASKVYHCPGTKYYGTTKKGSYMTESEATAAGNHADHKKICSK